MKTTLFAAAAAVLFALSPTAYAHHVAGHQGVVGMVATHGADTIAVGDLHLFNRRAIETPPNARNAGGFLSIYNYSSDANRLVSASSPVAERVELHTMTMENDVMRMREMEDGIELPGEAQVDLEPGGLHIMFMGLSGPFVEGDEVPVTLVFEGGEEREIALPVRARSMDMNHGSSDDTHDTDHGSHN